MTSLSLTKHHGAGNDFLVIVDLADRVVLSRADVAVLCDRRRGVGADGLIRVLPGRDGADLSMELRNADGSPAEMSGNGIRCLAQAAVDVGAVKPPSFTVATAAGFRAVEYRSLDRPGLAEASVEMGPVTLGHEMGPVTLDDSPGPVTASGAQTPVGPQWQGWEVDAGNPHLVLLGPDPTTVDVSVVGPKLEAGYPEGINVELVSLGPVSDELTLRVWERGVGETLACGTGSCAAAAAVHAAGLVGSTVRVRNPGGTLTVFLHVDETGTRATLSGPTQKVADVTVDLEAIHA